MKTGLTFLIIVLHFISFGQGRSAIYNNLLNIKSVDQFSDGHLELLVEELRKNNTKLVDLNQYALEAGWTEEEIKKLDERIITKDPFFALSENSSGTTLKSDGAPAIANSTSQTKHFDQDSRVFGSELFSSSYTFAEPTLNVTPPDRYVLGPGDELSINIYGVQLLNHQSVIANSGNLQVPVVGEIYLAGLTYGAAVAKLRSTLGKVYRSLLNGGSKLSVGISNYRSIQITIIGAKKSGNYTLSSLSTVFSALYLAGGPSDIGSYRQIQLIRNNEVIKTVDLYQFLVNGRQDGNTSLKDFDVIRVTPYDKRVTIEGEVKRAGIFELLGNETFADLLSYCSGFKEEAYRSSIKLKTTNGKDYQLKTLTEEKFKSYVPQLGDHFTVGKIANYIENMIEISGAVFRPDQYEFKEGTTISGLLELAGGLTEEAFSETAQLLRRNENLKKTSITINLDEIRKGNKAEDLLLKKDDVLIIQSKLSMKEDFFLRIEGSVLEEGQFEYLDSMTLYDLIILAGGLKEGASDRIEISRMLKSNVIDPENIRSTELFTYSFTDNYMEETKKIVLKPNDIVKIRKKPVYEVQKNIKICGAVVYPGIYSLENANENILDLISRAGGLKKEADRSAIKIIRKQKLAIQDSFAIRMVNVPVNYDKIIRNPTSKENIVLVEFDEIVVPKFNDVVKILGYANLNSEIPYHHGKGVRYYVNSVGGFKENKSKKDIYVIHPNGYAKRTKNYLFFKDYPRCSPGCEIIVPQKEPKEKRASTGEIIAISSVVGSFAGIVIALMRIL